MKMHRKQLPAAILLASGLATSNAFAQLEEVLVTAQKRTESLQDIPVAISAYDAGNIESMGHETFVYGTLASGVETILHVPGHLPAAAGDSLPVAFDTDHLHVFHGTEGRAIARVQT